ncbi:uncharacterized protein N7469_000957 [Penicillium citrinum]|uniref:Uncharacterized protein n=1 Tax=Penicillium citrinum TaxID=5077 RepID=A0A9W9PDN2_PENCI|nr:uncharacterized protein N7469_000957 [Penicillium citrinum]KAJ5242630.1 hypothetical protein N7469_000957 [Penicillium citrinum]
MAGHTGSGLPLELERHRATAQRDQLLITLLSRSTLQTPMAPPEPMGYRNVGIYYACKLQRKHGGALEGESIPLVRVLSQQEQDARRLKVQLEIHRYEPC